MMRTATALLVLAMLASAGHAHADGPPARVEVRGARVHARDLFGAEAADVDLGPAPPAGASRSLHRAEIERAFAAAGARPPAKIPAAVKVTRRTRRLGAPEVAAAIRGELGSRPLPKGASLVGVRAAAVEVAADFERVRVDLPQLPRRTGRITLQTPVTFVGAGDATIFRTIVPIDLELPPAAAHPDIARGATISLVVRRGRLEVTIPAVAATDADVGALLPVSIRPSGRIVRARAVDRDHAVAVEGS